MPRSQPVGPHECKYKDDMSMEYPLMLQRLPAEGLQCRELKKCLQIPKAVHCGQHVYLEA